jgi:hypothetical protein
MQRLVRFSRVAAEAGRRVGSESGAPGERPRERGNPASVRRLLAPLLGLVVLWTITVPLPDLIVRGRYLQLKYALISLASLALWILAVHAIARWYAWSRAVAGVAALLLGTCLAWAIVGSLGYYQFFKKDALSLEWEFILENPRWAAVLVEEAASLTQWAALTGLPLAIAGALYLLASRVRLSRKSVAARGVAASLTLMMIAGVTYYARPLSADLVGLRAIALGTYAHFRRGGHPKSLPVPQRIALPTKPARASPNVLFVLHESLGRGQVAEQGKALQRFIQRHPERAVSFPKASAMATATTVAIPVILSGLSPQAAREDFARAPLLWHAARAHGYQTALFSAQEYSIDFFSTFFLGPDKPDRAMTAADYRTPVTRVNELGVDDALAVDAALEFMRTASRARPYLAVVQFNSTHWPCWAPSLQVGAWRDRPKEVGRPDPVRCGTAAAYVDQQAGRLLEALESSGRLEDTLVIVTADHGEVFRPERPMRRHSFFEDVLAIPLVLVLPSSMGDRMGAVRANAEKRVSSVDIVPTVLDVWGDWPNPPVATWPRLEGQSLIRPWPERHVVSITDSTISHETAGFALYFDPWKWFFDQQSGVRLVNLDQDPDENQDHTDHASDAALGVLRAELTQRPYLAAPAKALAPKLKARLE